MRPMSKNGSRMRGITAAAFAAIASLAIATAALAGGGVVTPHVNPEIAPVTVRPVTPVTPTVPGATSQPNGTTPGTRRVLPQIRCANINWKTLRAGSQVPISCFPALPARDHCKHRNAEGDRKRFALPPARGNGRDN